TPPTPGNRSDTDEAISFFNQPRDVGWRDPLPDDAGEVVVGCPTGNRASLSDIDGNVVLTRFGEQLAGGREPDPFDAVAHALLHHFGRVAGEDNADGVTDLDRSVHR